MHSEMMAIHSALSAGTLASSAGSSKKPCFKLSSDSKRKARLRREAIKVYAENVCKAALEPSTTEQRRGPAQVQEWRFEGTASQSYQAGPKSSVSPLGGQGGRCGCVQGGQYGETPEEEPEKTSTRERVSQPWTSQTPSWTVCA
jgi:hypothetical protein